MKLTIDFELRVDFNFALNSISLLKTSALCTEEERCLYQTSRLYKVNNPSNLSLGESQLHQENDSFPFRRSVEARLFLPNTHLPQGNTPFWPSAWVLVMGGRKQAGEEELQEGGKALQSRLLFRSTVDRERKDTEMVGRSMEEQLSQKHPYK